MSKLVIENISAGYGSVQVLHNVSIDVNPGETVVLLGTNGNGKSTLLKSVMGLLHPSNGSIRLDVDGQEKEVPGQFGHEIGPFGPFLLSFSMFNFDGFVTNLSQNSFFHVFPRSEKKPRQLIRGFSAVDPSK